MIGNREFTPSDPEFLQLRSDVMVIRVGINGFGRIGRNLYRAAMDDRDIEIVAVNDITDPETLAHLLKYDSVLGNLKANVSSGEVNVKVGGQRNKVLKEKNPSKIDWAW